MDGDESSNILLKQASISKSIDDDVESDGPKMAADYVGQCKLKEDWAFLECRYLSLVLQNLLAELPTNTTEHLLFKLDNLKTCSRFDTECDLLRVFSYTNPETNILSMRYVDKTKSNFVPLTRIRTRRVKCIFERMMDFIQSSKLPLYDVNARTGFWKAVMARANNCGETLVEVKVCFETNTEESKKILSSVLSDLKNCFTSGDAKDLNVESLVVVNSFDKQKHILIGKEYINEFVDGLKILINCARFSYWNPYGVEELCKSIVDMVGLDKQWGVLQVDGSTPVLPLYLARVCKLVVLANTSLSDMGSFIHRNAFLNDISNFHPYAGNVKRLYKKLLRERFKDCHKICIVIFNLLMCAKNHGDVEILRSCNRIKNIICVSTFNKVDTVRKLVAFCDDRSGCGEPFILEKVVPVDMSPYENNVKLLYLLSRKSSLQGSVTANRSFSAEDYKKFMQEDDDVDTALKHSESRWTGNVMETDQNMTSPISTVPVLPPVDYSRPPPSLATVTGAMGSNRTPGNNQGVAVSGRTANNEATASQEMVPVSAVHQYIRNMLRDGTPITSETYATQLKWKTACYLTSAKVFSDIMVQGLDYLQNSETEGFIFQLESLKPCTPLETLCDLVGAKFHPTNWRFFPNIRGTLPTVDDRNTLLCPLRYIKSHITKQLCEKMLGFIRTECNELTTMFDLRDDFWKGFIVRINSRGQALLKIMVLFPQPKEKRDELMSCLREKLKYFFLIEEDQSLKVKSLLVEVDDWCESVTEVVIGESSLPEVFNGFGIQLCEPFLWSNLHGITELSKAIISLGNIDGNTSILQIGLGYSVPSLFLAQVCGHLFVLENIENAGPGKHLKAMADKNNIKNILFTYRPLCNEVITLLKSNLKNASDVMILMYFEKFEDEKLSLIIRNNPKVKKIILCVPSLDNVCLMKFITDLCKLNMPVTSEGEVPFVLVKVWAVDLSPNDYQVQILILLERGDIAEGGFRQNQKASKENFTKYFSFTERQRDGFWNNKMIPANCENMFEFLSRQPETENFEFRESHQPVQNHLADPVWGSQTPQQVSVPPLRTPQWSNQLQNAAMPPPLITQQVNWQVPQSPSSVTLQLPAWNPNIPPPPQPPPFMQIAGCQGNQNSPKTSITFYLNCEDISVPSTSSQNATQPPPFQNVTQPPPFQNVTQLSPFQNLTQLPPFQNATQSPPVQITTQPPPVQNDTQPPPFENAAQPLLYKNTTQPPAVQIVTQPPAVQIVTQLPSVQNATQPPPFQNTTQPPPFQNTTQPTPFQNATQPPPFQNTTQTPPFQNTTQTPPFQNTTQPPPFQNTTQPTPFQNATQPPPFQNTTQTPPFQNTTQTPPFQNTTQPPPFQNTTQPPPFQNTTQPPPFQNATQPPSFQNATQPPPFQNTTQPPPFQNTTQFPPFQRITQPPPVQNPSQLPFVNDHPSVSSQPPKMTQLLYKSATVPSKNEGLSSQETLFNVTLARGEMTQQPSTSNGFGQGQNPFNAAKSSMVDVSNEMLDHLKSTIKEVSDLLLVAVPLLYKVRTPGFAFLVTDTVPLSPTRGCSDMLEVHSDVDPVTGELKMNFSKTVQGTTVRLRELTSDNMKRIYRTIMDFIQIKRLPLFSKTDKSGFWSGFIIRTNHEGKTLLSLEAWSCSKLSAERSLWQIGRHIVNHFQDRMGTSKPNSLVFTIKYRGGSVSACLYGEEFLYEVIGDFKVRVYSKPLSWWIPDTIHQLSRTVINVGDLNHKSVVVQVGVGCDAVTLYIAKMCKMVKVVTSDATAAMRLTSNASSNNITNLTCRHQESLMHELDNVLKNELRSERNICVVMLSLFHSKNKDIKLLQQSLNVRKIIFMPDLDINSQIQRLCVLCQNWVSDENSFLITKAAAVQMSEQRDDVKLVYCLHRTNQSFPFAETNEKYSRLTSNDWYQGFNPSQLMKRTNKPLWKGVEVKRKHDELLPLGEGNGDSRPKIRRLMHSPGVSVQNDLAKKSYLDLDVSCSLCNIIKNDRENDADEPFPETDDEGDIIENWFIDLDVEDNFQHEVNRHVRIMDPTTDDGYQAQVSVKQMWALSMAKLLSNIFMTTVPLIVKDRTPGFVFKLEEMRACPLTQTLSDKFEVVSGVNPENGRLVLRYDYAFGGTKLLIPMRQFNSERIENIYESVVHFITSSNMYPLLDPKTEEGFWKRLVVRVNYQGFCQVVIEGETSSKRQSDRYMIEIVAAMKTYFTPQILEALRIVSFIMKIHYSREHNNSEVVFGQGYIDEVIEGFTFKVYDNMFSWSNPYGILQLANVLKEYCGVDKTWAVMCVGVGDAFTPLYLSKLCGRLIILERSRTMTHNIRNSFADNDISNIIVFKPHLLQHEIPSILNKDLQEYRNICVIFNTFNYGAHNEEVAAIRNCPRIRRVICVSKTRACPEVKKVFLLCKNSADTDPFVFTKATSIDFSPHEDYVKLVYLMERENCLLGRIEENQLFSEHKAHELDLIYNLKHQTRDSTALRLAALRSRIKSIFEMHDDISQAQKNTCSERPVVQGESESENDEEESRSDTEEKEQERREQKRVHDERDLIDEDELDYEESIDGRETTEIMHGLKDREKEDEGVSQDREIPENTETASTGIPENEEMRDDISLCTSLGSLDKMSSEEDTQENNAVEERCATPVSIDNSVPSLTCTDYAVVSSHCNMISPGALEDSRDNQFEELENEVYNENAGNDNIPPGIDTAEWQDLVNWKQIWVDEQIKYVSNILEPVFPKVVLYATEGLMFLRRPLEQCTTTSSGVDKWEVSTGLDEQKKELSLLYSISPDGSTEKVNYYRSQVFQHLHEDVLAFFANHKYVLYNPETKRGNIKRIIVSTNELKQTMLIVEVSSIDRFINMNALKNDLRAWFLAPENRSCDLIGIRLESRNGVSTINVLGNGYLNYRWGESNIKVHISAQTWPSSSGVEELCSVILDVCGVDENWGVLQFGCGFSLEVLRLSEVCKSLCLVDRLDQQGRSIVDTAVEKNILFMSSQNMNSKEFVLHIRTRLGPCRDICVVINDEYTSKSDFGLNFLKDIPKVKKIVWVMKRVNNAVISNLLAICEENDPDKDRFIITEAVPVDMSPYEKDVTIIFLIVRESTMQKYISNNDKFSQCSAVTKRHRYMNRSVHQSGSAQSFAPEHSHKNLEPVSQGHASGSSASNTDRMVISHIENKSLAQPKNTSRRFYNSRSRYTLPLLHDEKPFNIHEPSRSNQQGASSSQSTSFMSNVNPVFQQNLSGVSGNQRGSVPPENRYQKRETEVQRFMKWKRQLERKQE